MKTKESKGGIRAVRKRGAGFTLLEVLIGLSILTVGILSVIAIFPTTMKGNEIAELRTIGAWLAMQKVEEIRRDNDENNKLINAIRNLTVPTAPLQFGTEPRLSYFFSSRTILYQHRDLAGNIIDDPSDPRDDPGIPRIIIQTSPKFHPGRTQILDEYMFDK